MQWFYLLSIISFLFKQSGNTPLHNAAASGLKRIVELLVSHGAPLFLENTERLTPCDVAMKANFHDIALYLESRMVFVSLKLFST